jgi:hypothetical protein
MQHLGPSVTEILLTTQGVNCIHVAQHRDHRWALANMGQLNPDTFDTTGGLLLLCNYA